MLLIKVLNDIFDRLIFMMIGAGVLFLGTHTCVNIAGLGGCVEHPFSWSFITDLWSR